MKKEDQESILSLAAAEITPDEFLDRFGASRQSLPNTINQVLQEEFRSTDADGVDCALLMGFVFGFDDRQIPILCELSDAGWHHSHENVVMALDSLRTPLAVDTLYRATLARHKYLAFDDSFALAVKALYALSNINNRLARDAIRLASQSGLSRIAEQAAELLTELETG